MVDIDPTYAPDRLADRFAPRPAATAWVDGDEHGRIGPRWIVATLTAIAVLVGLGIVAAVASLRSTDDDAARTATTPVALQRFVLGTAPAGTRLADVAETPGAATSVRRSVAVIGGPAGAVATVTAQLDDGSRWPPAGVDATVTLANGDTGYLDPDLVWRRGGVRYRAQLGTDEPDRTALVTLADGVRPTANATRTEPAAFTVTAPPGWRVRYVGSDPDDAPTATALYRGEGRTVQVVTWAIDGAASVVTARATEVRTVVVRGVTAELWRDEDGPLTSTATAHLVWQEPDGPLVAVRATGLTDDELVAAAATITPATDAQWNAPVGGSDTPPPPTS